MPPETTRNWLELPRDVMTSILKRLGAVEILETAQKVCMLWRSLCKVPSMWRAIDMCNSCYRRSLGDPNNMRYYLEKMCIHAIDQSQFRPAARCPHQELWLRRAPHLHCPEVLFFFSLYRLVIFLFNFVLFMFTLKTIFILIIGFWFNLICYEYLCVLNINFVV